MRSFKTGIFLAAAFAVLNAGCSKYIKNEDKPAYNSACAAIAAAENELKLTDASESRVDMSDTFLNAKSGLVLAGEYLERGSYAKAEESAKKVSGLAKEIREIPNEVNILIAGTERSLQFAVEVGLDKAYGKKLKEIKDDLWEAKSSFRQQKYRLAKELAGRAFEAIRKAIEDVEKANYAMTRAKTCLGEAKAAGADVSMADLFKSAEEAAATAKAEMENANFVKCREAAEKACALAKEAAEKAKAANPR
ncbi:MAG: hypothetical protein WCI43_02195 [Candidatus Firestonebacteria bacterium]